ncbi:MAG: type II secretion system GspH family protein [Candidatus Gastranaerophilales bacterium]|nr:type II secretion system GspH family protein [Candidatus Gastranaerophilales bacterium]
MKNIKAFTLSEVLIALVIIGVIAAITVPFIYAQYTEQERISKVKKTYSMLANAMIRVKADGGDMILDIDANNYKNVENWFNSYLKNYIIVTKICYNDTAGCWNNGNSYNMDGSTAYMNNSGIGIGSGIITFVLNDGTFININVQSASSVAKYFGVDINTKFGLEIYFDINGSKKPNTIGKDIFAAVFTEEGIVPAYKSRSASQINSDCSSSGSGYTFIQKYLVK